MFGGLPDDAVFADDAGGLWWLGRGGRLGGRRALTLRTGTHYMFRPTHLRNYNMNFGHLFIDDILSAYIAMQVAPFS